MSNSLGEKKVMITKLHFQPSYCRAVGTSKIREGGGYVVLGWA